MPFQKCQTGRDGDRWTKISTHGIDCYPDHGETGVIVGLDVNKRKARR